MPDNYYLGPIFAPVLHQNPDGTEVRAVDLEWAAPVPESGLDDLVEDGYLAISGRLTIDQAWELLATLHDQLEAAS